MSRDRCEICGGKRFRGIKLAGEKRIVRCLGCGLVFQHPRPTMAEAETFYRAHYFASTNEVSHGYEDYAALAHSIRRLSRRKLRFMEHYVKPGTLLDVGAAYGLFLDEAKKADWRSQGVEISPEAAKVAHRLTGLPVHVGPLERTPIPPERFDAVTCWDVVEHATELHAFLGRVRDMMKRGGWFFATVPNVESPLAKWMGTAWFGYAKLEHVYYFSPRSLRRAVEMAGLEFVGWQPWPWACTVDYVARRLGYYSRFVAGAARAVASCLGIAESELDFPWIDIIVVARKP